MQISQLKTLIIPNLNDVLPILDIDGGVSGKPILRKATLSSLLALTTLENATHYTIPTLIKTVAADVDYVLMVDSSGTPYKITKANLLAGLSSGGTSGGTTTDPYFSDVVFLSHLNSLVDVKGKTITAFGNAAINSTDGKFTSASALFDGSGDYLQISAAADLNFSTGQDFTIEFFVKFNTLPSSGIKAILARSVLNSDNTFNLDITSTNIRVTGWYTIYINALHGFSAGNWYYMAVTREGNVMKLFINGTQAGSYTGTTNFPNTNNFTIGGDPFSGAGVTIDGRVDEMRISKRARVINSVPTSAFPDS